MEELVEKFHQCVTTGYENGFANGNFSDYSNFKENCKK